MGMKESSLEKIKHISILLGIRNNFKGDGPGDRHDDDFADIWKVTILAMRFEEATGTRFDRVPLS
jgi:hypothetical protein